MVNICITSKNNLNLPYIYDQNFASLNNKFNDITEDELEYILQKISNRYTYRFSIYVGGGEPLLHPDFYDIITQIIYFCEEQGLRKPILLTNAIELEQYLEYLQDNIIYNIIIPPITQISLEQKEKFENTLNKMNELKLFDKDKQFFNIDLSLQTTEQDINYFIDIMKKYPTNIYQYSCVLPFVDNINKKDFFINLKNIFLNFFNLIQKNNLSIATNCNAIPLCFFDETEQQLLRKKFLYENHWCDGKLYFLPNKTIYNCSINTNGYSLDNIINIKTLCEKKLKFNLYDRIKRQEHTNQLNCNNCLQFSNFICSGGCLQFDTMQRMKLNEH